MSRANIMDFRHSSNTLGNLRQFIITNGLFVNKLFYNTSIAKRCKNARGACHNIYIDFI
jgi:hypothetical protein